MLPNAVLDPILRQALTEDIGPGDVTTEAILTGDERGRASAIAKSDLVVAGGEVFREVFLLVDPSLDVSLSRRDGDRARPGDGLAELNGRLGSILTAERTALNFFQRLCGIATLTRRFVEEIDGTGARILDTRKTAPGLRLLDKYAVRVGGGRNHRFALFDGVLIKDNHIAAAGGIAAAVAKVRRSVAHLMKIEVECKNVFEVEEALAAGADAVMLDNMDLPAMREAVTLVRGRVPLEASGNVTLANVRSVAQTGVDFISVGALTHSVAAADISLIIQQGT